MWGSGLVEYIVATEEAGGWGLQQHSTVFAFLIKGQSYPDAHCAITPVKPNVIAPCCS